MPTLPKLEQLGLAEPRPQTGAVGYRATSGYEEAPSEAATKFGETVQQIAFQQQDALNTTRAEDAWNQYKSKALDLSVGNGGFATVKGGNAINGNLFKTYSGQLADVRKQIEGGLGDDDVRRRFADRANVTDLQFKDSLLRHYTTESDAYEKQTFDGSVATASSMVAAAPMDQGIFDTALLNTTRRAEALAQHQGITDQGEIDKIKDGVRDALITKRIDSLLYSNPIAADQLFRLTSDQIKNPELRLLTQHKTREAALSVSATIEAGVLIDRTRQEGNIKTGAPRAAGTQEVGFNGAVESLLKREGGYSASDGKSGTPVNFGINQAANPDINVAKLTKDQAKEIYKTRYWDAIGGDALPQATAIVALDAAALQGVEVAKKLIFDTDGDPQTMIDIRRQQLTALAARDPAQVPYLPQWLKRLDGLEAQVSGMQNVAYHPDDPTAQNTSGLPNSRDLAAQLPMMEGKVDQRTNELYGADPTNPDWQAFNKRMKSELHAKVAADVQQLAAIQRQAQGTVIDAILGSQGGTQQGQPAGAMTIGGQAPAQAMVTSFSQIQANPDLMRAWQMLDPGAKPALLNLMNRNLDPNNGDVKLYRDLFNRVHLEPGDPKKIDFYKQIVDPSIADRLSMQQIQSLRAEIDRNETPGGRSLNQMRLAADANVALFFRTNIMFTSQPDRQIAATMKWNEDVGKKIDDYVKAGQTEKVRAMFMLDTPESVVSQKYLQTYVNSTPAQGLAAQAAAAKAGGQATQGFTPEQIAKMPQVPPDIKTREDGEKWLKTLPPTVTTFRDENGVPRLIPGRQRFSEGKVR
ncbi:MAG TPA: glycosyl hydrolase 108 family protein [Gammaproteobacteria bacterium]|nr:glycosyl hydrolase 108 family protein [Gammaproteobacteria bacterium]